MIFVTVGAQMPFESDPARVWTRVFGPSVNPDPLAKRRKGVLDYAYASYKTGRQGQSSWSDTGVDVGYARRLKANDKVRK